jgi:hypothetical protein
MIGPMSNERIQHYPKKASLPLFASQNPWRPFMDFLPRHPVGGIDNQNQQKSNGLNPSSSFKNLDQHHNDGDYQQGMKDTAHRIAG